MFSPGDVCNFVKWGGYSASYQTCSWNLTPCPKTHVALYWERMLPLTAEHRQPTTMKLSAFRGEKPSR